MWTLDVQPGCAVASRSFLDGWLHFSFVFAFD
jgi:hypothetical protein